MSDFSSNNQPVVFEPLTTFAVSTVALGGASLTTITLGGVNVNGMIVGGFLESINATIHVASDNFGPVSCAAGGAMLIRTTGLQVTIEVGGNVIAGIGYPGATLCAYWIGYRLR